MRRRGVRFSLATLPGGIVGQRNNPPRTFGAPIEVHWCNLSFVRQHGYAEIAERLHSGDKQEIALFLGFRGGIREFRLRQ